MILFPDEKNCCGCGACKQACPKQCISFYTNEDGFKYPKIDSSKCINCGLCNRVCAYQKSHGDGQPIVTYFAQNKDNVSIKNSASGGIFTALANYILEQGGVVFGCALDKDLKAHHIVIESKEGLSLLQGSKYIQSEIGDAFIQVRKNLQDGRKVLFSGTPCQTSALYGFLMGASTENLVTMDLVCHGVSSQNLFDAYISYLEEKNEIKITDFKFRDKTGGWGVLIRYFFERKGKKNSHILHYHSSSYGMYYLEGKTYRENCYVCPYAGKKHDSDFTVGDYWGIEKVRPDITNDVDVSKGASCVMVNTEKGLKIISDLANTKLVLKETSFEDASKFNHSLKAPVERPVCRDEILNLCKIEGFGGVEHKFKKDLGFVKRMEFFVYDHMPLKLKKAFQKINKH